MEGMGFSNLLPFDRFGGLGTGLNTQSEVKVYKPLREKLLGFRSD